MESAIFFTIGIPMQAPKTASYIILTMVEAIVHDTMFHNKGKNKKAVMQELTALIVNYLF